MSELTLPFWHRHRFRWVNGIGFSLSVFYGMWLVVSVVAFAAAPPAHVVLPAPLPFVVVGGVSLVLSLLAIGVVMFGFVFRGADLGQPTPRYLLYAWTLSAGLFFLSQALALGRFGPGLFPGVPEWLTSLYWYFVPVGAVVFGLLSWVNAEAHHMPWEEEDPDEMAEADDALEVE